MLRRKRNLISDINVVPYIDVMLVLLVIFMIAAPLMVQGVLVNLPEASADPLPVKQSEPLIVSIKDNGAVFLEVVFFLVGGFLGVLFFDAVSFFTDFFAII